MVLWPSFQGPGIPSMVKKKGLDTAKTQSPYQDPDAQAQGWYYSQGYSLEPSKEHRHKLIHKTGTHVIACSWSELWPTHAGGVTGTSTGCGFHQRMRRARLFRLTCPHPRHDRPPRPCDCFPLFSPPSSSCVLSTCPGFISNGPTLRSPSPLPSLGPVLLHVQG